MYQVHENTNQSHYKSEQNYFVEVLTIIFLNQRKIRPINNFAMTQAVNEDIRIDVANNTN